MLFSWSAECAEDDPVLVVPWSSPAPSSSEPSSPADPSAPDPSSPAGGSHFVDLREDPFAAEDLLEAELHPPLLQALRALNAARSLLFTAKCDAWTIDLPEELDLLRLELDLTPEDARAGFASYIDLLWRDRAIFASVHQHEHLLHRLDRRITSLDHPFALVECVLRPALLDLVGPQQGFALTLYVKAVGFDHHAALAHWSSALAGAVAVLRSRDLTPNT